VMDAVQADDGSGWEAVDGVVGGVGRRGARRPGPMDARRGGREPMRATNGGGREGTAGAKCIKPPPSDACYKIKLF
jgi:hypothetical protein